MAKCAKDCSHYAVCAKEGRVVQVDAHTWDEYNQLDNVEKYCTDFNSNAHSETTKPTKVVIVVEDGMVSSVYSSDPSIKIEIEDLDSDCENVEPADKEGLYCITGDVEDWCDESDDADEYGRGDYDICVMGMETYTIHDAKSKQDAFTQALDNFANDDLYYGSEEAENATEDDCEVVWFMET